MNYIREINAFYDWLETNTLSDSAIALWHALMHINNKTGWKPQFAVAISVLESKTGLKRSAIFVARNRLKTLGRISFQSRSGQQSALYTVHPLIPCENTPCVLLTDTNPDTKANTNPNANPTLTRTINKLNKTKKNIPKDAPVKTKYAERVLLLPEEHQKLLDKFGEAGTAERIERLSLYKQSTGKKYDSDYATILNWARKDEKENGGKVINMKGERKGEEYYTGW